jgi:RNA polymerase sigma factor (sigma-70 family)
MTQDELIRFVEPIYRFCMRRLHSHQQAEDLAQDILLCVWRQMRETEIRDINAYVWRIARNRYARLIDKGKHEAVIVYGYEALLDIPQPEDDNPDESALQSAFCALHTLSRMYRDIVVNFYVHGMDVNAIALRHNLSSETVKWRLHVGRQKMRERIGSMDKQYEKIKMHIMCNGSFHPNRYLDLQMYKAIAKVCYEAPLNIEEISLATGIPTLYLEDAIEHMLYGDALKQQKGQKVQKYATDFIITNAEQNKQIRAFLTESAVNGITDTLLGYIKDTESGMRDIGFYGSDFPLEDLLHVLVPGIIYARAQQTRLLPKQYPIRKDGGRGWFIVTEGIDHIDEYYAGSNGYHYDSNGGQSGQFTYYWTGDTYSEELDQVLKDARFFLNCIGPGGACMFDTDDDAAKALSAGLCVNKNGRTYPAVPVFTGEQYGAFSRWALACPGLDEMWEGWIAKLFEVYKQFTPKRLADQIGGNVDGYSHNLSVFVIKQLQARGLAALPQNGAVFSKNLLLVRG